MLKSESKRECMQVGGHASVRAYECVRGRLCMSASVCACVCAAY